MLTPVEHYLNTAYRPDREYVGGEIVERNLGEYDHSRLQMLIAGILLANEALWSIRTLPEQRVQVSRNGFRIPDICAIRRGLEEQVITRPPVLCIEVPSKDDTASGLEERVRDYLRFGVPTVWVVDPRTRLAFIYTPDGIRHEASDGILRAVNPGYPGDRDRPRGFVRVISSPRASGTFGCLQSRTGRGRRSTPAPPSRSPASAYRGHGTAAPWHSVGPPNNR